MRAIFLNTWFAKAGEPFYKFISNQSPNADIICLSEVSPEMFSKLKPLFSGFIGHYEQGDLFITENFYYGQAIFVKKDTKLEALKRITFGGKGFNKFVFAVPYLLEMNSNRFFVLNVHGQSRPGNKLDTEERIRQSKKILKFLKSWNGPKIVGGDFNLMPQTKSIGMLENSGLTNLIKKYDIERTRNELSWNQFPNEEKQYFADYVFVSPGINVLNFEVPKILISDHLPLILDFEI